MKSKKKKEDIADVNTKVTIGLFLNKVVTVLVCKSGSKFTKQH